MIGNQGQQEFRNLNQGQNYESRKFQPDYYQSQEKAQGDLKSEVHFLGQIVGGLDFSTKDGIFCEMLPDAGENWDLLEPQQKTYISQTCYADEGQMYVWNHPFDLHFAINDLQGWPNAVFKVWRLDETNKIDILAYGIVPLPKTAGFHTIYCNTWSPMGDWRFGSLNFFLGNQPQIPKQGSQENSIPYTIVNNDPKRSELLGISNGKIVLEVECVLKNFTALSTTGDEQLQKQKKGQDYNKNQNIKQKNFWETN